MTISIRSENPSVVVIGLGNPFRRDDGIGPAFVTVLRPQVQPHVTLVATSRDPTELMAAWADADLAIVVDAAVRQPSTPGRIHRYASGLPADAPAAGNTHGVGVSEAIQLATVLDRGPHRLVLFAVEAADTSVGHGLSPAVEAAIPTLTKWILGEIGASAGKRRRSPCEKGRERTMSAPEPTPSTNSQADDASEARSHPSGLARYFAAVETSVEPAESGRAESAWLLDNLVVGDVMTSRVVSVRDDTPFKQIIEALANAHVSALPVVDADGHVLGIVSESDLLAKVAAVGRSAPHVSGERTEPHPRRKADAETARDLMTAPVVTTRPDARVAHAARVAALQHVRRLPVVDSADRLVGIVTRSDLLRVFLRDDEAIRQHVVSLIRRQLFIDTSTIDVTVADGVVTLRGQLDSQAMFEPLVDTIRDTTGVVAVHDNISYRLDQAP
jgi:hydrogenase maturation protease